MPRAPRHRPRSSPASPAPRAFGSAAIDGMSPGSTWPPGKTSAPPAKPIPPARSTSSSSSPLLVSRSITTVAAGVRWQWIWYRASPHSRLRGAKCQAPAGERRWEQPKRSAWLAGLSLFSGWRLYLCVFATGPGDAARLHALAIAGADQARDVLRTHPAPCRMRQPRQKRPKPSLQIASPALVHHHRAPFRSAHTDTGLNDDSTRFLQSAKVSFIGHRRLTGFGLAHAAETLSVDTRFSARPCRQRAHHARPSMSVPPPPTSALRTPAMGLAAVPRICRTASITLLRP